MSGLIKLVFTFLSGLSPKTWLWIFTIAAILGGLFWFRHSIYAACDAGHQAEAANEKVTALEKENLELKQYRDFLLVNQKTNENFIKSQKKALKDANEKDGDVAPVLRGVFDRMPDD